MRKHRARKGAALGVRPRGKRRRQILNRYAPVVAIDDVGNTSDACANPAHNSHREQGNDCRHDPHGGEFDGSPHMRSISHDSKSAAGSIDTVMGSTATSMSQRTASFSVVTIDAEPAARAAARMVSTSRAEYQW